MATRPMKTITGLPGLEGNTYTFLQLDNTLAVEGKAADAKKVGDELTDLKSAIDDMAVAQLISGENYRIILKPAST